MVPDVVFRLQSERLPGEKEQSASVARCEVQGFEGAFCRVGQKTHVSQLTSEVQKVAMQYCR